MEMTGCGKRGKPNPGFPRFLQPLEIALAIPTFPQPLRGAGKWKTKNTFPTFPLAVLLYQNQSERRPLRRIAPLPPSGSFLNEKMLKDGLRLSVSVIIFVETRRFPCGEGLSWAYCPLPR
jgi:hypothetical protein